MQSRYTLHQAYNSSALNMRPVLMKRTPRKAKRWAPSRARVTSSSQGSNGGIVLDRVRAARGSVPASGSAMTPAGDCSICSLQIIIRFEGDILKAYCMAEIGGAK